jgi:hypothetical protein
MRKKCEGEYPRRLDISVIPTPPSKCSPTSSSILRIMYLGKPARCEVFAFGTLPVPRHIVHS